MTIKRLEVTDFRNLTSVRITPSSGLNLLFGENASGKTSLLEAIYFLANARSFRTGKVINLIKSGCDCFTLFSENITLGRITHRLGLRRCRNGNDVTRLDGSTIQKRSVLLDALPLQLISPESLALLVESSEKRRSFIDWGLFHVEQSFRKEWLNFSRALKQRNALLRQGVTKGLNQWTEQFTTYAESLTNTRREYLETLLPYCSTLFENLLPGLDLTISYQQGWEKNLSLSEAMIRNEKQDVRLKYTTAGPQRADLFVRYQGRRASEILSRGQMKLVVFALLIAQMEAMSEINRSKPILLIDDLAAELDDKHRKYILDRLKVLDTQTFVTTPDKTLLDITGWRERKMFHVEHGEIKEMV